ncbi:adenylate cyclase [Tsuneonella mangrovi]|uniref:adenylate cyclase n=1 Tax=Tsuneonella mangrovi TaxID=1982042 RepID=UPI000BA26348|nr:adenylate cyclase [Tsuneonella mangrovi]
MATAPAEQFALENQLYWRIAVSLSVFILIAFGAFNALGVVDITQMPRSTHLHAIVMISWLGFYLFQSRLGAGANVALHRKLGWFGAVFVVLIFATAWNTGFTTHALGRTPPAFSHSYFLALTLIEPAMFVAMVFAAIILRKQTDWHRRLMLGGLVILLEPALGRALLILSVPMMGGPESAIPFFAAHQWVLPMMQLFVQVVIVLVIMLYDQMIRGTTHPALRWVLGAVVLNYALIWTLSIEPTFRSWSLALWKSAA